MTIVSNVYTVHFRNLYKQLFLEKRTVLDSFNKFECWHGERNTAVVAAFVEHFSGSEINN